MGSLLLAAGAKGKRFSLPLSRIMIHQPLGGAQGQSTDIQIQAREIQRIREVINHILVNHTNQEYDKIMQKSSLPRQRRFLLYLSDIVFYFR